MRNPNYMTTPTTLGQLKASGYRYRTVKEELRSNLVERLRSNRPVFPSIVGYEDTVVPALERAVLAGHDVIMLGERGQAKSRLMRALVDLLDDVIPVVEGSELNDHPYNPVSAMARDKVTELGDETPIVWVGRDLRYSEKLATPDTAVADLIGDVDPIRVAEGRYLGDELTIHYGLVPRTNRGIVAINELPDLPERIQVSLLNILEERDIQVRGYQIRLPLDVMLIASANPEDYTHRGRIITPLKDRFGTQVRTHYPERIDDEIAIMEQEAKPVTETIPVRVPRHLKEVIAEFTAQLRSSSQVNQRSGVSVRFSIGALETIGASALRRAIVNGEEAAVPRAVDLYATVPASIGRIEFDMLEEGRELSVLERALKRAILDVWHYRLGGEDTSALTNSFDEGLVVETSEMMGSGDFLGQFEGAAEAGFLIERLVGRLDLEDDSPASRASALEFGLEGLHLTKQLNKETTDSPGRWRFESEHGGGPQGKLA